MNFSLDMLLQPFSHVGMVSKYAMLIAFIFLSISIACCTWRVVRGPMMEDRILALDTLYINAIAVIILLGLVFTTRVYFDVALLVAMFGFIGTVVLAKFLFAGDITK